jgi:ferredoxin
MKRRHLRAAVLVFLAQAAEALLSSSRIMPRMSLNDDFSSGSNSGVRGWVSVEVTAPGSEPEVLLADTSEPLLTLAESVGIRAPSECRRGNCLSCAARLAPGSSWNYETAADTFLCAEARDAGFILTCCTRAVGPGLKIELEQQAEAFQIQFYERFAKAREEGFHASLREMTAYNERHPDEWIKRTEESLSAAASSSSSAEDSDLDVESDGEEERGGR